MFQSFEDTTKASREMMDTGLKSFASLSKNLQTLASEAGDYSKASWENGSATLEKLFSAKSFDKAVEIQTDYAKKAYEGFVAQAAKMGDIYAEMAKDAYKPFENAVAKAK
ncbi:MAG: phasin family protein [Rhizobiaceae bacterium]|nr:phasin family protein [Rhizobiaceae bacterium]